MDQKSSQSNGNNPKTATGIDYSKNMGAAVLRDYSSKGKKKRFWIF